MGMGRIPGNLPIELIADYCNEYMDKVYDIDFFTRCHTRVYCTDKKVRQNGAIHRRIFVSEI